MIRNKKEAIDFYPITSQATKKGPVAERLGRGLQNLVQRFESARDLRVNRNGNVSLQFLFAIRGRAEVKQSARDLRVNKKRETESFSFLFATRVRVECEANPPGTSE